MRFRVRAVMSGYRGTSLIRNTAPLEPYRRTMPKALWWSQGRGLFLISKVPLYRRGCGLSTGRLSKNCLCSPVCGLLKGTKRGGDLVPVARKAAGTSRIATVTL